MMSDKMAMWLGRALAVVAVFFVMTMIVCFTMLVVERTKRYMSGREPWHTSCN